jgi:hypothetical protein
MLRRFSLSLILIIAGIGLITIAFLSLSFLPSQIENGLSRFFGTLSASDSLAASTYRRIYADRLLLQSIYVFLLGIALLTIISKINSASSTDANLRFKRSVLMRVIFADNRD